MSKTLPEIYKLLSLGEGQTVEFKSAAREDMCGPQVCAFLNSHGGYLLCGVSDKGTIIGIENASQTAERIEAKLKMAIQPPVLFSVEVQPVEGKQLLVIEVPAGKDIPYAYKNDIYVRIGESTQKADVATIRDMVLRKQIQPERWERLFSSELNESGLSKSACKKLLSAKRIPESIKESEQGLLHQLQLLSLAKYGRLTNAADVLLGDNPGKRHPQARVRAVCYRHKGDDNYQDLQHFDGPMAEVIEQLINFVARNTPSRALFAGAGNQREDVPLYPLPAVREAIVNAFAHRDYSSFAGGIKLEVGPQGVKIWNSGSFPEGVDQKSIQQGQISVLRNPDIAHGLYLQGYMEKLGRGSVVIQQACKEAGLPSPVWESNPSSGVTLTLFAPEVTPEVTPEVSKMLAVLTGEMGRDELQSSLNLRDAENFRKKYLRPASALGLIEMTIPEKPNSRLQKYRLTSLGEKLKQSYSDENH